MIKPMLAVPMSKGTIADWNQWAIERKYDGWRLIVQVPKAGNVRAWTRPRQHAGAPGKTMAEYQVPDLLALELRNALAVGVYDGELLGGATSTDVNRVDIRQKVAFVVFDVLDLRGQSTLSRSYDMRQRMLEEAFTSSGPRVSLSPSKALTCQADVTAFVNAVWADGGEGAIIKRRASVYLPGKRSPDWIKVKKVQHEAMTVVGFKPGRGLKVDRGPFAMVALRGEKGLTSVKTVDDDALEAFQRQWEPVAANIEGTLEHVRQCINTMHPALGRKLVVEFQDWTPTDGYRHPRWDRWNDE